MVTKQHLIKKIEHIDDPDLLNEQDWWISSLIELSADETFSKEEISAVKKGYQEYLDGKTVTHEEFKWLFDEWLKEK